MGVARWICGAACALGVVSTVVVAQPKPTTAPTTKAAKAKVGVFDASTLFHMFDSNPVDADDKYKGRGVVVKGKIASIGKDNDGIPYIIFEAEKGKVFSVLAAFNDPKRLEQVKQLSKRQGVTLYGIIGGMQRHVILVNCRVLNFREIEEDAIEMDDSD